MPLLACKWAAWRASAALLSLLLLPAAGDDCLHLPAELNLGATVTVLRAIPVVLAPSVAMMLGSISALCARIPEKFQASMQNFSAGLLMSAVAGELYPLISAKTFDGAGGLTCFQTYTGLISGFIAGLVFMYGVEQLTEGIGGVGDDEGDSPALTASPFSSTDGHASYSKCSDENDLAVPFLDEGAVASTLQQFRADAEELATEANRLMSLVAAKDISRLEVEEQIQEIDCRVRRAQRNLTAYSPLDPSTLTRIHFHARQLTEQGAKLEGQSGIEGARRALTAFSGTLRHLHGHAGRCKYPQWEPKATPSEAPAVKGAMAVFGCCSGASKEIPWPLFCAVVVDAAVDGLLIGLAFSASESAGWAMSVATSIEMGFLGLSFSATLENHRGNQQRLPRTGRLRRFAVLITPPLMLLIAGLTGHYTGHFLKESPGLFIGFISFSIVALLFLVTRGLLPEAQDIAGDSILVNSVFFVGLLAGILMERMLDSQSDSQADC